MKDADPHAISYESPPEIHNDAVISHVKGDLSSVQTNADHSAGVARLAMSFASEFDMGEWGRAMGLLHDKGKERRSFQAYIRKVTGLDMTARWHGEDKTHAFVGAKLGKKHLGAGADLICVPISGHHAGLPDPDGYDAALAKAFPTEISEVHEKFELEVPKHLKALSRDELLRGLNHVVRMLYSCLVDADYFDTEKFMHPAQAADREGKLTMEEIKCRLDAYLLSLSKKAADTPLNRLRKRIQDKCLEASELPGGFFSLCVPTGGGKTLSGIAWAVNHALANGLRRVVIAIPYTSVVAQTAAVLTSIFGEESVLEHHSDFDPESIADDTMRRRMKLATENWDYPIVVTTNVQLFQSMYANRPSACRKLHNLAKSVVILDEVQSLPLEHLQPIIDALESYRKMFGTSFLFSTASLPALQGEVSWGRDALSRLRGVSAMHEIIPADWKLHNLLRRVNISVAEEKIRIEDLAGELARLRQVLCVVNTRQIAQEVYEYLPATEKKLHLSRMMCSAHIKEVLDELKDDLREGRPLRVIATQLIEAGVDIDFPVVYRQEAGLDSILQAAGRCNREGRLEQGEVKVFRLERHPFGSVGRAANAWQSLPANSDWLDPEVMTRFFVQLYSRSAGFDKGAMASLLYKSGNWEFETASRAFRLIDEKGACDVIVNYGESPKLVEQLRRGGAEYGLLRKLGRYSVRVRKHDFESLEASGLLEEICPGIFYVADPGQYSLEVGLNSSSHWQEEIMIL